MRAVFERVSQGEAIEDVFITHGIIDNEEYILLKRAISTLSGIESIIAFREEGNQFFVLIKKVVLPFLSFVFLGIFSFLITSPMLKDFLTNEVGALVKEKRNFDVQFDLPFFVQDEIYIQVTIFFLVVVFSLLIYYYLFLRKTKIYSLYKFSHLSFYDDFVKYFTIASMMKKSGANSDQIFEDLSFQAIQGLQPTFRDMFIRGSDFHESLSRINAPYRISALLRRNEENSKFWENLDSTVLYVKNLRRDKVDFYVKYFSKTFFLLGLCFFIFCLAIPVLYLILNIYAFAM